VTIANAMKYSLNTTFDLLASQAGPDNVAATAHAMGIATRDSYGHKTLQNKNGSTSFGIGIGDYPVTPLDQAVGFATLANNGVRNDPFLVIKATASDGEVVYRHTPHPAKALNPRVANDVTLTLEPVAAASGGGLQLAGGRVSAAKTGTEGVGPKSLNNSDAWMVGYTPQVSAAVWYGTGVTQPIFNSAGLPMYGADEPGHTWQLFMDTYLANKPKLPMATKQMIFPGGSTHPPSTSAPSTKAPSTSASTSKRPSPSFSLTRGFPSTTVPVTPVTPAPVTSSTTTAPPSTPTNSCSGLISFGCQTG
jgi:membrane peptidoglycan carboxypeptidase